MLIILLASVRYFRYRFWKNSLRCELGLTVCSIATHFEMASEIDEYVPTATPASIAMPRAPDSWVFQT